MERPKDLISITEASTLTGINVNKLRQLIKNGNFYKYPSESGRLVLVSKAEIEKKADKFKGRSRTFFCTTGSDTYKTSAFKGGLGKR